MKNIENEVSNPICCQNVFCIYWKQEHCLLDRLSIDQQGLCKTAFTSIFRIPIWIKNEAISEPN